MAGISYSSRGGDEKLEQRARELSAGIGTEAEKAKIPKQAREGQFQ